VFINPAYIPFVSIGFLSHLLFDGFQKRGIKLLGFGNTWARYSLKWDVPLRSSGEYAVALSAIGVILISSWIIQSGGTNHIIRKALGTLRANIEEIHELKGYELHLIVTDRNQTNRYEIVDALTKEILVYKNTAPILIGNHAECHINMLSCKAYVERGRKISRLIHPVSLHNLPLRSLNDKINTSYKYFISGIVYSKDVKRILEKHERYNTVIGSGRKIELNYATLEDLSHYSIENAIVTGEVEIEYRIYDGQSDRTLALGQNTILDKEVGIIKQRKKSAIKMLNDEVLLKEFAKQYNITEKEIPIYKDALTRKLKTIINNEEKRLNRIGSLRKDAHEIFN